MNINWNFPDSNNSGDEGLNDAGIETFKGNHGALAKEIIQNSYDAKDLKLDDKPVIVEFSLMYLNPNELPGSKTFLNTLESCKEYWPNDNKAEKFFEHAITQFTKNSIPILRISDFNTTGLTGSDTERGGNWNNLVKSNGATNKSGNAGGSFGIGKKAAFSVSNFRTIFYSTFDCNNMFAFQGVSSLVSHNMNGIVKRSIGYYGNTEKNAPIFDIDQVNSSFYKHRPNKETGTDVFILDYYRDNGWEDEIIKSAVYSFFEIIHNGKLVVIVNNKKINSDTLPVILEEYNKKENGKFLPYSFYKALAYGDTVSTTIDHLGEVELKIYSNDGIEENNILPSKVALTRNGMTIRTDRRFPKVGRKYAGVFKVISQEGNIFLRTMEPPAHDKWEASRFEENEALAKRVLDKLYKWIRNELDKIAKQTFSETSDAYGIGQYLPGENNESGFKSKQGSKIPGKDNFTIQSTFDKKTNVSKKIKKKKKHNLEPSDISKPKPHKRSSPNKQLIEKDKVKKRNVPVMIKKLRSFCLDQNKGLYRIIIGIESSKMLYIRLKTVAEDNGKIDTEVLNVKNAKTNESYLVNNNVIGPLSLEKNRDFMVDISLNGSEKYALEVLAHEIIG